MFRQPKEDIRVADYVLGLMDADEIRSFQRDMMRDPTLAARVEDWRARVALIESGEPDTPHAAMRQRIVAGLRGETSDTSEEVAPPRGWEVQPVDLPSALALGIACLAGGMLLGGAATWLLFGG